MVDKLLGGMTLVLFGISVILLGILISALKEKRKAYQEVADQKKFCDKKIEHFEEQNRDRIRNIEYQCRQKTKQMENDYQEGIDKIKDSCAAQVNAIQHACDRRIAEIQAECALKLKCQAELHAEELEHAKKTVQQKKFELAMRSEKELLVEVVHFLQTEQNDRFERLNQISNAINQQVVAINSMLMYADNELGKLFDQDRRREQPCTFEYPLTESVFREIVDSVIKRHEFKRIINYFVEGTYVGAVVNSNNGNSTWNFCVDFSDQGEITGEWALRTDNTDSMLPRNFAEAVRKEIIFVLHNNTRAGN